jgi:hypothetical protein
MALISYEVGGTLFPCKGFLIGMSFTKTYFFNEIVIVPVLLNLVFLYLCLCSLIFECDSGYIVL